jgi:D-methionine transport system substrate-binding protein
MFFVPKETVMTKTTRRAATLAAAFALLAPLAALAPASAQTQTLKIGVTPGPHAQIMEVVKAVAAKKGLDLKVSEFSDYVVPNQALDAGELDANSFQHKPYLDNQVKDRGYKIETAALTVNFPMGIYSKSLKTIGELKDGASVSIPNDPTNGGRALLLLQDKGLLKLRESAGLKVTVADIVENPKKLKIVEVDAAQSVRALDDVALAAINTNYAIEAKLDPTQALLREDPKGPYVNLIAVRAADKDKPWVKTLIEAYHSPEVKAFVQEKFKGAVLASW